MAAPILERKPLWPAIAPYKTGTLRVSDIHTLYYEEAGNPEGKPFLVVHGGPGGGCADFYRQYVNPQVYRMILFDQRGAARSTPRACLEDNTTWHLVDDIEKLRNHLKVDRWVVFGGSWGATLALAYAQAHTDRVKALILRGIFTVRRKELTWFYQEGASFLFPEAWEKFLEPIPPVERFDLMSAYYRRLTGKDEAVKLECGKAWSLWEMATSRLYVDPALLAKGEDPEFAVTFSRIECHYFVHGAWWKTDEQLLEEAHKLAKIPTTIVQGRYDLVCPATTAWDLFKRMPHAQYKIVHDAGHSMKEPGIIHELVEAGIRYENL